MRALAFCCLMWIASPIGAQALPNVDLALTMQVIPEGPVPIGTRATLRMTVTNLSTERAAFGELVEAPPIPPNVEPFDIFEPNGLNNCSVCLFLDPCLRTELIPPGESRSCERYYISSISFNNPARGRVRVLNQDNVIDPNPLNNFAQIEFIVQPLPQPQQVPLSAAAASILALSLLIIGAGIARRYS
jgi:hypothetical protein